MLKKSLLVCIAAVLAYMLRWLLDVRVYTKDTRIDGMVVIVTGANTGIGKETSRELVSRGGTVYMACRSLERGRLALDDIRSSTMVTEENIKLMQLDLASMESIRDFVAAFKTRETKLNILINNAGVAYKSFKKTQDGFEYIFGINHLGTFYLTHLLADMLVDSAPSRIVTVSSAGYLYASLDLDNLMPTEENYTAMSQYCLSKLGNVLFSMELGKRLQGTGVTTYSLHPGHIVTDIARDVPVLNNDVMKTILTTLAKYTYHDPWHGAQTTLYCALDEDLHNHTAKYYSNCCEEPTSPEGQDEETARKLWDISLDLLKLKPQDIHPSLR